LNSGLNLRLRKGKRTRKLDVQGIIKLVSWKDPVLTIPFDGSPRFLRDHNDQVLEDADLAEARLAR